MRREFPDRIRAQIIKRAMNERGLPVCEGCGAVLKLKAYEIDHKIPEALVVDKTKELTAQDGQLLGACCHRGEDGKTKADMGIIAKAKRRERKHLLSKRPKRVMLGSRASKFKAKVGGGWEWRT